MSISYDKILGSSLFEFIVGPNRERLAIHADLATHHSVPLGVLIHGPMCEAHNGVAELDDVDEQTFVRFCEYAYTGNYTSAQHNILLDSSIIGKEVPSEQSTNGFDQSVPLEPPSEAPLLGESSFPKKDKKKEVSSPKQTLWNEFGRNYDFNATPSHEPRKNVEECEDYTDVFLCHARVYVFAEKYDIAQLRNLALYKLQRTLQVFDVYDKRIGDIVSLVRYAYSNDNTRDSEPGQDIDKLRKLITHYVVCVFDTVAKDKSFLLLMEEGGPFPRDLASILLRRIT